METLQINKDYKLLLYHEVKQTNQVKGGHNKETFMLNVETFKKFCLKAGTKKADEVHDYFIKLENIMFEIAKEESEKLKHQVLTLENKNKSMEVQKVFEVFLYAVPALITGIIAYYFFKEHTKNEAGRRRFLLHKDIQVNTLPIRLQAYERMALFLERITPSKLLIRISPTSSDKNSYESLLISSIEQEFEHNLSQQIYISDDCWNVITAAKNATIQLIRKASLLEKTDTANKLQLYSKKGSMEKCFLPDPSKNEDLHNIEVYCTANFPTEMSQFMECKIPESFCYTCCEREYGPMQLVLREKCYNERCKADK